MNETFRRAELIGLSPRKLCAEASVPYASLHRWRQQPSNPLLRNIDTALSKLEGALIERERNLLVHLLQLHPDLSVKAA